MMEFNHFPEVAAALRPACVEAVAEITLDVKGAVQDQIMANGQYVTGFMYGSVYASTWFGSDYGTGPAPPTDDVYLLPGEIAASDLEGVVGVAANYAIYQNDGTRFMPPHPFFEPALERGGDLMDKSIEGLVIKIEAVAR